MGRKRLYGRCRSYLYASIHRLESHFKCPTTHICVTLWATVRRPRKTVLRNPQFFMLAQGFHQSISWRHTISHRDFLDCEPHNRD